MSDGLGPKIRYVCFSDMHLGEADSLLTHVTADGKVDPLDASPVLVALIKCLRDLVPADATDEDLPTLILNGDILELALARTHQAAMVFERFLERSMSLRLFQREIIFIPGNHDHHLWEIGRENQYTSYLQTIPNQKKLPIVFHTTGMFSETKGLPLPRSTLLTELAKRATKRDDVKVLIAYPNHAVLSADREARRGVVFTHGHYIEWRYALLTKLWDLVFSRSEPPQTIYQLEGENFAWIDFIWSAIGRSGKIGQDIGAIYDLRKDPDKAETLLEPLVKLLAKQFDVKVLLPGTYFEEKLFRRLVKGLVRSVTRFEREIGSGDPNATPAEQALSGEGLQGLRAYVHTYLHDQIREERNRLLDADGCVTTDLAFVFGHTHKPFARMMSLSNRFRADMRVYNTGGWVIESRVPDPAYGACVALVDDAHDVVNLCLYRDQDGHTPQAVDAGADGTAPTRLSRHVQAIIEGNPTPWSELTDTIKLTLQDRRSLLKTLSSA
ncbi:MAG: metallophosphoesterase [Phycisphaerae bacterium]|nr:metallophosphoesterase [Phycisphaerae bacterium]